MVCKLKRAVYVLRVSLISLALVYFTLVELAPTLGIVETEKNTKFLRGKGKAWSGCLGGRGVGQACHSFKDFFLYVCASVCDTCVTHVRGAYGGRKRARKPVQQVGSCPTMLGAEPMSFGSAASALNC